MNALVSPLPRLWTPDEVEDRLTDALRVVVRTAGSVGPRGYANGMPEVVQEFAEIIDPGMGYWEAAIQRIERSSKRDRSFTAQEVSEADEALGWISGMLADELARDAVWLVTLGRALGANVDRILRRRRAAADAMIDRRKAGDGFAPELARPDIIRIYEDDARDLARKWTQRANEALSAPMTFEELEKARLAKLRRLRAAAKPSVAKKIKLAGVCLSPEDVREATRYRNDRIRQGIRIAFRREAIKTKVVERIVTSSVTRQDVMPGKHFNPRHLYEAFHGAIDTIVAGLSGVSEA